jgi:Flp pilus assembly protein TadG
MIEAALGALILIPIALGIVDLITIVIANSMNDTAAKNCARAGANQPNQNAAFAAGEKALASFQKSGIVKSLTLDDMTYQNGGVCSAFTIMVVKMPVPVPGFTEMTFNGRATEPVVGQAPR